MKFVLRGDDEVHIQRFEIEVWFLLIGPLSQYPMDSWEKRAHISKTLLKGYGRSFNVWTEVRPLDTFHTMRRYLHIWDSTISFLPNLFVCFRQDVCNYSVEM